VLLLGAVWMGQGLGYIRGSFMTGEKLWFWIGLACVVLGTGLLAAAVRRRRTTD
jgi:dipeptide/tripeptide permease